MTEYEENRTIKRIKNLSEYLCAFGMALLAFVLYFVSQYIVFALFVKLNVNTELYQGLYSFLYSMSTIIVISAFIYIEGRINKGKGPVIKFKKNRPIIYFLVAVFAFGMIGITTVYMTGAQYLSSIYEKVNEAMTDYQTSVDRYAQVSREQVPLWDNILYYVTISFIVPLSEELVFRASVFGYLRRKFRSVTAILISTLIFALLHVHLIQIGYAFLCGLLIAIVYYETSNLAASFMLHSIFNILGSTIPQMVNDGVFSVFGLGSETGNILLYLLSYWEIVLILPAIVAFIMLIYFCRKERKSLNT